MSDTYVGIRGKGGQGNQKTKCSDIFFFPDLHLDATAVFTCYLIY